MAHLREASGWTEGAPEARMRLYLLGEHHPQHARAPRVAYVAEAGGAIVGFIAGHRTTRFGCEGELQWLLVAPAHRGGGAARQLLLALAGWFGRQGTARVCVNMAPEKERARRFYRRHGAQELRDHWLVWPDIAQVPQRSQDSGEPLAVKADLNLPRGSGTAPKRAGKSAFSRRAGGTRRA